MECGRTQKQLHAVAKPSHFSTAGREITDRQPEATGQVPPQEEPNGGKIKEDNARLLAQMPASSVSRKPGGNNRQERKDAVSGREDGNRGNNQNRVARVECARCGVLFTFLPDQSVGNSSQLPCTVELRLFLLPHAIFYLPIFLRPDTHTCAVFRSKQTAERNHHVCANVCNSLL